jgi:hypothetical protein
MAEKFEAPTGSEQKYESPEARGEQTSSTKATNENTSGARMARGKAAKSAASAYVRECEAVAASMFSVGGKRSKAGY